MKKHKPKRELYSNYKRRAKEKKLNFHITFKYFLEITKQNCFYCNINPNNKITNPRFKNDYYIYNGIDRIDNNKGYIYNNCVPCCKICNQAKSDNSLNGFLEWTKSINTNLKKRSLI